MKSLKNTLFNNKSLLGITALVLLVVGSTQNPMFFILPVIYFISISIAYFIGAKINDYGINAAYNWSIKWALFVFFNITHQFELLHDYKYKQKSGLLKAIVVLVNMQVLCRSLFVI